jgi:hypothetical protein
VRYGSPKILYIKAHVDAFSDHLLTKLQKLYAEALRQATGNGFLEAFVCTGKVMYLSLICLVYRAIPPEANSGTIFGKECISSAHKALETHRQWMSLVTELDDDFLESYVNMHVHPPPSG